VKLHKKMHKAHPSFLRLRSRDASVTHGAYARLKRNARDRAHAVKSLGAGTPQTEAYRPLGGPEGLYGEKRSANQMREDLLKQLNGDVAELTEREQMLAAPFVPLDDPKGLLLELEPHSDCFAKVDLHNLNECTAGRHSLIPRAMMIALVDVKGTPDLFVMEDSALADKPNLVSSFPPKFLTAGCVGWLVRPPAR
jgi:hypothetical protein